MPERVDPWQRRREAALLLAAAALAYANSFAGAYQFDDFTVIADEPAVQSLAAWWDSMPGMRPLLKLSWALNHASGLGLAGMHASNLAVHAACALGCWSLLRLWLPQAGFDPARSGRAAWFAAMVFALHPAQTEAVTYLSGRSMALMALFSLATLALGLRAARPSDWRWPASALCFAAALLVRETAWAALPALALLALARGEPVRQLAWRVAPLAAILLVAAAIFWTMPVYRALALGTLARHDAGALVATQVEAVFYLLTRPLLLLELNIDPDLRPQAGIDGSGALRAVALAAIAAVAAWQWRPRPWLAAALLWPFVMLAPGYSLFARADVANDRHLYLALLGPSVIAGAAIASLPRRVSAAATVFLCALLGLVTVGRNEDYRSESALWRATAACSPDKARVWNNLGFALMNDGDLDGARAALSRALALEPGYQKAFHNLAAVEARRRRNDCPPGCEPDGAPPAQR